MTSNEPGSTGYEGGAAIAHETLCTSLGREAPALRVNCRHGLLHGHDILRCVQ
jgi:hypothetical protein